jgi:hypothetical protein
VQAGRFLARQQGRGSCCGSTKEDATPATLGPPLSAELHRLQTQFGELLRA